MRIAVLVADIGTSAGGLYYSVRAMSAGASELPGNEVAVFAMGDYPDSVMKHWNPLQPHSYSVRGLRAYGFAPGMLAAVKAFRPDVVHTHGLWMYNSRVAYAVKAALNCPVVLSPRGMMDIWAMQNSAWKKKLVGFLQEKRFLSSVDCFHALNQSEANSIRSLGYTQPICVIPNGTDLPAETAQPSGSRDLKRLVFIGRIHPKKGISNLLLAWGQLMRAQPSLAKDWKLTIAGWEDGNHLSRYLEEAKLAGCADTIEWPGSVYGEAKHRLLVESDAFILPSFSEGLPMSVVEAWAYRLPVVMTPQCNLPEGFESGAAIRVEPQSDSILQGLNRLVSMAVAEREAMGVAGYELVASSYTWAKQVELMQGVYGWLLSKGEMPKCMNYET